MVKNSPARQEMQVLSLSQEGIATHYSDFQVISVQSYVRVILASSERRAQQPTPAFLPGKSHGQRSLVGYRPRGCNELD